MSIAFIRDIVCLSTAAVCNDITERKMCAQGIEIQQVRMNNKLAWYSHYYRN